jgi:hypothetical protein
MLQSADFWQCVATRNRPGTDRKPIRNAVKQAAADAARANFGHDHAKF